MIENMTWYELFMRHVYLVALKSKDPRTKIGAILVKDGIIISEGFNGFARGVQDYPARYDNKNIKYKFIVHGEANAVINCVRHGVNAFGATIFTQGIPCNECAKTIVQAGINRVVTHAQWPSMNEKWQESILFSKTMFDEAGVFMEVFDKKLNLIGYNDGLEVKV